MTTASNITVGHHSSSVEDSFEKIAARRIWPAILILFVGLAFAYSLLIPAQMSIDEGTHFQYVFDILRTHQLPVVGPGSSAEEFQPPLYYLASAALSQLLVASGLAGRLGISVPLLVLMGARWVSLLAGLLTVWSVWELTALLFPGRLVLRCFVVALVALDPTFLSISASVTNDSFAIAFSSLAILAAARLASRGASGPTTLLAGLALGLGALSKLSALVALAPVLVALLLVSFAERRVGPLVRDVAVVFAVILACAGWWWWRGWLLYRDPLGSHLEATLSPSLARGTLVPLSAYPNALWTLAWTYLAALGPMGSIRCPAWVVVLWLGMIGVAALGLGRMASGRGISDIINAPRARTSIVLGVAVGADLLAIVVYAQTMDGLWHGRFLLPAGIALAGLIGVGLSRLDRDSWLLLGSGMLALAIAMPTLALQPLRTALRLTPATPAEIQRPLNDEFAHAIRLEGVSLAQPSVAPGQPVKVIFYWRIVGQVNDEWTLFVHLNDAEAQTRAQHDGVDPMRFWPPGQLIAQPITFTVPANLIPGDYSLRAGFYQNVAGRLIRPSLLRDGAPKHEADVPLGDLQVRLPDRTTAAASPTVHFDDGIALVGWTWAHGTLTLDWTADQAPHSAKTVFVHLLGPNGQIVAQHDGPPASGNFPTIDWRPGDLIVDPHAIPAPPGSYAVEVGLYDPKSGARVQTQTGRGGVVLGTVRVTGSEG